MKFKGEGEEEIKFYGDCELAVDCGSAMSFIENNCII
jgi:hypothetical protein